MLPPYRSQSVGADMKTMVCAKNLTICPLFHFYFVRDEWLTNFVADAVKTTAAVNKDLRITTPSVTDDF
jgi:hypothetical protein